MKSMLRKHAGLTCLSIPADRYDEALKIGLEKGHKMALISGNGASITVQEIQYEEDKSEQSDDKKRPTPKKTN